MTMEAKKKVSKKALRALLQDSLVQTFKGLELPNPNKKVKKLVDRASKKLASHYASLIKRDLKRASKSKSQVAVAA
jgi:hypothetical protein